VVFVCLFAVFVLLWLLFFENRHKSWIVLLLSGDFFLRLFLTFFLEMLSFPAYSFFLNQQQPLNGDQRSTRRINKPHWFGFAGSLV